MEHKPTLRNHFCEEVLSILVRNFILHKKNFMLMNEVIENLNISKQNFYHHMKHKNKDLEKNGIKLIKSPEHKSYKIFVLDTRKCEAMFGNFNKTNGII